jgi:hypothetical protein
MSIDETTKRLLESDDDIYGFKVNITHEANYRYKATISGPVNWVIHDAVGFSPPEGIISFCERVAMWIMWNKSN